MHLAELFNTVHDYEVEQDDSKYFVAKATINGREIYFRADAEDGEGSWWIIFNAMNKDGEERFGSFATTNDGNAPQVLAFIKRCMTHLITKRDPVLMKFSGSEGKGEVYRRMIDRFIDKKQYKVDAQNNRIDGGTSFRIIKLGAYR